MRTAEHMEHRNLERKWRPSFALGPHLTEGRSNDERTEIFFSLSCLFSVAAMHLIFLSADELVVAGNLSPRFLKVFRWYWWFFARPESRESSRISNVWVPRDLSVRDSLNTKKRKKRGARKCLRLSYYSSLFRKKNLFSLSMKANTDEKS